MPPVLRSVKSYEKAIEVLGGTGAAADALTRVRDPEKPVLATAICKWRTRHGAFPSDLYFVVQRALGRKGYKATPDVFTFEER